MESVSEKNNTSTGYLKKNVIKYGVYIAILTILLGYVYYTAKTGIESVVFNTVKTHRWAFDEMNEDFVNDVHVWYSVRNPNHPYILFCHGNVGNISHRKYVIDMTKQFDCSIILFDYCGYGKSKGMPTTTKILENGEDVYKWALKKFDIKESQLVVMGESLGGSVATHISQKFNPSKLILLSTFSCLTDVAKLGDDIPYYWKIASVIFTFFIGELPNHQNISKVKCPIMILHSKSDSLIPYANALKNYQSIPHSNKHLIEITGDHASPVITVDDIKKMCEFIGVNKEVDQYFPKKFTKMLKEIEYDLMNRNYD
jgi:pimeloyl-ACP methyl ester carboxylesterase